MDSGFLAELNKLKNCQEYLEKSNKVLNNFAKYDCGVDLGDFFSSLEAERKNETEQLAGQVKEIWWLLSAEKKLLKEGNLELLDIRSFKKRMTDLQDKIYKLRIKVVANYETLKEQEAGLSEITETFNSKISEWEKSINISRLNNGKTYKSLKFDSDYKEVKEFMDFVNKSNGHENGWASEDHQLFLKLRNKYKSVDDLAVNLHRLLPDITPTAVREHEAWFTKYVFLKRKKDEVLDKWRKLKVENVPQHNNAEEMCENKIKNKIFPKCDEDVQKKIAQWKAEKEIKRQQEKFMEEIRKEKIKRLDMDKKRLHYQMKETVTKWKEEKLVKQFNEKILQEVLDEQQRKIRAFEANKRIKQFQSQDDIYIGRMRSSKLTKKTQTPVRSKSSYSVPRDPERILKPTKQWLIRTSKNNFLEENVSAYVPNIKHVPKLAIPDWRKNT